MTSNAQGIGISCQNQIDAVIIIVLNTDMDTLFISLDLVMLCSD